MLKAVYNRILHAFNMIQYRFRVKHVDAVLLNTPLHGNLGDHAIALCEMDLLSDLNIKVLDYPWISDDYGSVARSTPKDKLILISGGGYMGDLWPIEEYKVREIIRAFKDYKIIILPQTVSFDVADEEQNVFMEGSIKAYSQDPDLSLFVRESISYRFVKDKFQSINVSLVPDMAMLLNYNGIRKREGVLVCLRGDKEGLITPVEREKFLQVMNRRFSSVKCVDTVIGNRLSKSKRKTEVGKMLDRFAEAEIVVTDRLHGMIFSAVTATPCVAICSRSHKIRGCYEWLKDLGYIKICDNVNEVPGLIDSLKDAKTVYNNEKVRIAFGPLIDELKN